ncbi:MAG: ABC transporter ATP-binding protein [Thermoplasmata archaeon]
MDRDAVISIEDLGVSFTKHKNIIQAVDGFSLQVRKGEFVCILGPSGCGKTTVLRVLAGLQEHQRGTVRIERAGQPNEIPVTLVFQDFALFPWRTVRKNIEFPLETRKIPSEKHAEISRRLIDLVNLEGFENAHPKELSGGMKQRVAIARALATDARVLLMDEPFGSLDAQTRNLMQKELLDIWRKTKSTIVFVTHSVDEAVFLADRVVVMTSRPGRVKRIFDVNIPRMRERTSADFIKIRGAVLAELQQEFDKAQAAEHKRE